MGVAIYFFASGEVEPNVRTTRVAVVARAFKALEVDFGHSLVE